MATDPRREGLLRMVESRPSIDGRFSVVQRVGHAGGGGYHSMLFSAEDATTRTRVALKICNPDHEPGIARAADIYALGCILFELFSGTVLGEHLFTDVFINDLVGVMAPVASDKRRAVYEGFVDVIADTHRLPSVADFGAPVPGSIRSRIDDLLQGMASIDYRKRLTDFNRVFRQIEICLLILRNEAAFQRQLTMRRQRRAAAHL